MKKQNKIYYLIFILLFTLLISLFVVASFYDLKISMAIVDFNNKFAMLCANFGEMPSWILIGLCGVILFKLSKLVDKRVHKILALIFSIIFILVSTFFIFNQMRSRWNGLNIHILLKLLIAIILEALILLFGFKFININEKEMLLKVLIIIITTYVLDLLIMLVMKEIWLRPRYRLIYSGVESYSVNELFRAWYEPGKGLAYSLKDKFIDGSSDQFKSFPSGHSFGSMIAILLFYILDLNNKTKDKESVKYIVLVISILYGLMIALSRILYGAHYLSDVVFGGFIASLASFIIPIIVLKVIKNVKASKA